LSLLSQPSGLSKFARARYGRHRDLARQRILPLPAEARRSLSASSATHESARDLVRFSGCLRVVPGAGRHTAVPESTSDAARDAGFLCTRRSTTAHRRADEHAGGRGAPLLGARLKAALRGASRLSWVATSS